MTFPLPRYLVVLVLQGLTVATAYALEPSAPLTLLARSSVSDYAVTLDEADWEWLRAKRTIRLGTSAPDYLPFDISAAGQDFEGITADYAHVLGQLLHVNIDVVRYPSRASAIQALKQGDIDGLGTSNGFEAADRELALSQPYARDQPTLITRSGEAYGLSPDLADKRVAMLDHYLPAESVRSFYPKAKLQLYSSTLDALGAVAFDQADVYLGDSISAHYLINKNFLNNVQLADFSTMGVNHFSFALARDNQRLLHIVNDALNVIPPTEQMSILQRWSAGGPLTPGRFRVQLSLPEQRWLDTHPRVKVIINDGFLPFTYLDKAGAFRGISADVLTKNSQRTGLTFDVQLANSVENLSREVTGKTAQVVAALSPSPAREQTLRFTRPYLVTPFVLVRPTGPAHAGTLDTLSGKRLAIIRGNVLRDYLADQFPLIRLVDADSANQAMEMVAQGEVDVAINSLISANYMIARQYHDRLRIISTVGSMPARLTFAVDRGALELYSILDKALLSIPPQELDELTNRWRNEVVIDDSYWLRKHSLILQGLATAASLLVVAIAWIAYLRRLIRRRKIAEQALNDQVEFMRVLIDGTPHPIYVRDLQGRLLICNNGYLEAFQVDRASVMGKKITEVDLLDPITASTFDNDYQRVIHDDSPVVEDRTLVMANGTVRTICHWMLPYRSGDAQVVGLIAGWIDISERQDLLEQLRVAKIEAENANRAKTTFLATMSHEIRTPMNAVIGMLELAMKKADQGVLDHVAIEVASGAAQGLLDLLGDILDIAQIESGRLTLAPTQADLPELIETIVRTFEGLARQKYIQLTLDLNVEVGTQVLIDPLRFKQVLSNLLSNAIKFTSVGGVHLSVQATPQKGTAVLPLRIQVEDTGTGISEEDQQRLFNPFTQAGNRNQTIHSGSGLGLVISHTLCELMGGQLNLKSALGKGTQVEILLDLETLPQSLAPQTIAPTVHHPSVELSVLVVDDYPANRLLLSQQLNFLGHRVICAKDGAHGLQGWQKAVFDVVITDCNMPIMDGYELTRAIRANERLRSLQPCLILGFTANALADEKARCIEAGMDDCLFKPITINDLKLRLDARAPTPFSAHHPASRLPSVTGMDFANVELLTRGDVTLIRKLIDDLARSNDDDLKKLSLMLLQRDLRGLCDLAHKVKGGARIIKAHDLIQACENLETVCKQRLSDTDLERHVHVLQHAMRQLASGLETYRKEVMIQL